MFNISIARPAYNPGKGKGAFKVDGNDPVPIRILVAAKGRAVHIYGVKENMRKLLEPSSFKIGLLVIAALLAVYYWRNEEVSRLIDAFDYRIIDAMVRRRGPQPTSGRIAIVDIDEKSLLPPAQGGIGQWPWPRHVMADLLRKLDAAGVRIIGLDIVFAEPDRHSPKNHLESLRKYLPADAGISIPDDEGDNDAVLGKAIAETPTIVGYFMQTEFDGLPPGGPRPMPEFCIPLPDAVAAVAGSAANLPRGLRPVLNLPAISTGVSEGFFNAIPDDTGMVRHVPLLIQYEDTLYPHLTLEMYREGMGVKAEDTTLAVDTIGIVGVKVGEKLIQTDQEAALMINYRGPDRTFPYISATDIIHGRVDPALFKDKFIFIGTSATGLHDLRSTPFSKSHPGVEILAAILDNMLQGDPLRRNLQSESLMVFWLVLAGGLLVTASLTFVNAIAGGICGFVLIVGALLANYRFFFLQHQVVGYSYTFISILLILVVVALSNYFFEGRRKRVIRGMFQTMVSGDVLQYMEKNPGSFSLSGEERQATMFFSDVAGFTTISESLTPPKLVQLLNAYLTPMTEIILAHNGYVDKYEGDAIMAEWGVPFPNPDHARLGCFAALAQQEKLAEIRAELHARFGHLLTVRMGLNSGTVSAGNMGSDRRFSYTVMGDAVNQAARFEPANKDYDTRIMIGATTYELAKNHIEARLLDKIVVKGKTEPIKIYELIARKGQAPAAKLEVVSLYQNALEIHWERRFREALEQLDKALGIDPADGPSKAMRQRILGYLETPPPPTWKGEYVRAGKD